MQKKSVEFLEQVQKIMSEYDFPITLRQLYYQLVSRQIIVNKQKEYQKLSRLCVLGRNDGILAENSFIDRLREIQKPNTWIGLDDFMETVKEAYRRDYWTNQPCYLEIWSEKDALRDVISPVTKKYDVPLLIVRGQVSRTAIYETSVRYQENMEKDCHLFYFGDFDPSGLSIYESAKNRINDYIRGVNINFKRIALTPEQIKEYDLPYDPAKKSDPNFRRFNERYGDIAVELDSLPPNVLRKLIEDCILNCIDRENWARAYQSEQGEIARLQDVIKKVMSES